MHVARKVYDQYYKGESITDEDLNAALEHFKQAAESLRVMGPTFKLAFREAQYIQDQLNGFKMAREEKVARTLGSNYFTM